MNILKTTLFSLLLLIFNLSVAFADEAQNNQKAENTTVTQAQQIHKSTPAVNDVFVHHNNIFQSFNASFSAMRENMRDNMHRMQQQMKVDLKDADDSNIRPAVYYKNAKNPHSPRNSSFSSFSFSSSSSTTNANGKVVTKTSNMQKINYNGKSLGSFNKSVATGNLSTVNLGNQKVGAKISDIKNASLSGQIACKNPQDCKYNQQVNTDTISPVISSEGASSAIGTLQNIVTNKSIEQNVNNLKVKAEADHIIARPKTLNN